MKELDLIETEIEIKYIKDTFEKMLAKKLNLIRVSAPLFVTHESGLNDNLNGVERTIDFDVNGVTLEIIQSLAKWKRYVLGKYEFSPYTGLYTEMRAIRKDEEVDSLHSLYVEQYDWEKVILKEDRTTSYLEETVRTIYKALRSTSIYLKQKYKYLDISLPKTLTFISSQQLEDMYPELSPKEREEKIVKEKKAVFITCIGDKLKSGIPHDLRSPDYDDWTLDGDLLIYSKILDRAIEISSMGIRVDKESLLSQLDKKGIKEYTPYHKKIIKEEIPYTIGGGIGISRILLLLLKKSHIVEVQASSWDDKTIEETKKYKSL